MQRRVGRPYPFGIKSVPRNGSRRLLIRPIILHPRNIPLRRETLNERNVERIVTDGPVTWP